MRICLVAHFAYGAMAGGGSGHAGGVERQTSLAARWLARRGHEVSLLTWQEGPRGDEVIDGVRVLKMCGAREGIPGLRFFHPRWSSLVRAMRRADAELYYHNCAECHTGQIAGWCRRHGRKFVFSTANDSECEKSLRAVPMLRDRVLYLYGIRHADRIIVQTRRQATMMLENFGLGAVVLPMPCPGPDEREYRPPTPPPAEAARILWVGRITPVKRLEMLLDVARMLPRSSFIVAGAFGGDGAYAEKVRRRLAESPNVSWLGQVAREEMGRLYRSAHALCSTSVYEGFPNVYLEGWSHGLPIVTTFDPDGIVERFGLGLAAADAAGVAGQLERLAASPALWKSCSESARRYYLENHTVDAAMARFESLFLAVAGHEAPGAPLVSA